MSIEAVQLVMLITYLVLSIPHFYYDRMRSRSVRGSYQRYRLTSMMMGATAFMILYELALATLYVMTHGYFLAVMLAFCALLDVVSLIVLWHDNNWFNDQWKRAKRGLRKLRRRIAEATQRPGALPSPA